MSDDYRSADYRSGFVAFVGRPNAGKSTLMNALVGEKVAIMSSRPQTTRRAIRGIITRDDAQLIVVDTPGLHRPRTLLGQRLNDLVRETFAEVDVIGFCLPADEKVGPGDKWIARELADARAPVVAIVTKVDKVSRDRVAAHLLDVSTLGDFVDIVPVSSVKDVQMDVLLEVLLDVVVVLVVSLFFTLELLNFMAGARLASGLGEFQHQVDRMRAGDFTATARIRANDEIGRMLRRIDAAVDHLNVRYEFLVGELEEKLRGATGERREALKPAALALEAVKQKLRFGSARKDGDNDDGPVFDEVPHAGGCTRASERHAPEIHRDESRGAVEDELPVQAAHAEDRAADPGTVLREP